MARLFPRSLPRSVSRMMSPQPTEATSSLAILRSPQSEGGHTQTPSPFMGGGGVGGGGGGGGGVVWEGGGGGVSTPPPPPPRGGGGGGGGGVGSPLRRMNR